MTQRFVTHFSTVFLIHVALIVSGLTLIDHEVTRNLGEKVLNLKLASEVLFSETPKVVSHPSLPKTKARTTPSTEAVKETPAEEAQGRPGTIEGIEGSATGTALADLKSLYKAELRARIDQNKYYPAVARRLGHSGEPLVGFTLLPDGSIINIRILKSSSFARLDEAALEAVKAVKKFKPVPKEFGEAKIDFEVPVRFK